MDDINLHYDIQQASEKNVLKNIVSKPIENLTFTTGLLLELFVDKFISIEFTQLFANTRQVLNNHFISFGS